MNPLVAMNSATTLPASTICTVRPLASESAVNRAFDSLPLFHAMFTEIPPRTRAFVMYPEGHCGGKAGRRVIVKGVEKFGTSGACSRAFWVNCDNVQRQNISGDRIQHTSSAAGYPRFASIWNIGLLLSGSNRLNKLGPKLSLIAYCMTYLISFMVKSANFKVLAERMW